MALPTNLIEQGVWPPKLPPRRKYLQSFGFPSLSLIGLLYVLVMLKGAAMLSKLDTCLDWLKQLWLRAFIALNGYKFAALILAVMAIGARIDPTNGIFKLIEQAFPILMPWTWEVIFWICFVRMWTLKSGGRWEAPSVILAFLFPVITFYGFLIGSVIVNPKVTPFTDILIFLAVVTPVAFVTRTAAFNYYRDLVPSLVTRIRQLEIELEKAKGAKEGEKTPETGAPFA